MSQSFDALLENIRLIRDLFCESEKEQRKAEHRRLMLLQQKLASARQLAKIAKAAAEKSETRKERKSAAKQSTGPIQTHGGGSTGAQQLVTGYGSAFPAPHKVFVHPKTEKPEVKPEVKPAEKPVTKPVTKPAETPSLVKPVVVKPVVKVEPKVVPQPAAKPAVKIAAKPAVKVAKPVVPQVKVTPKVTKPAEPEWLKLLNKMSDEFEKEETMYIPKTAVVLEAKSSTTFKKCSPGAMLSTAYLRHKIPQDRFVNRDDDHPTWPIRPECRASLAGLGRALQYAKPGETVKREVLSRVNRLGGIKGKSRIRLWGTGVGGERMKTHRGKSGTPKRHKEYGKPTDRVDNKLHTAKAEHGRAGNREVERHPLAGAKPEKHKVSGKKAKREEKRRLAQVKRGKHAIGRAAPESVKEQPRRSDKEYGRTLAAKALARAKANKGKR